MRPLPAGGKGRPVIEIGWREMVSLPALGIAGLRAKIDTGARTSSLHALDLQPEGAGDDAWIGFSLPFAMAGGSPRRRARLKDRRWIKNTSGVPEERYIVETMLVLGDRKWRIEVSLANRENMGFELILGRSAIRGRRLLVNPGRSYLAGHPVMLSTDARSTA